MFNFSAEAIGYQAKDSFINDLAKIVDRIRDSLDENPRLTNQQLDATFGPAITKLVAKRTGMTVLLNPELSGVSMAAIFPYQKDYIVGGQPESLDGPAPPKGTRNRKLFDAINNVFIENKNDAIRLNNARGTIDFKNVMVTGYLTQLRNFLVMDWRTLLLYLESTSLEVAGVMLHEFGHAFYGLAYHYQMVTTNRAITDALDAFNDKDPKKVHYIFKSKFDVQDLIDAGLDDSSTVTDFATFAVKKFMTFPASQYTGNLYDYTSFEFLADQFCTRFGGAEYTMAFLNRLNERNREMFEMYKTGQKSIPYIFGICGLILGTCVSGVLGGGILLGLVLFGLTKLNNHFTKQGIVKRMANTPEIYDDETYRPKRMRQDLIQVLKDQTLPVSVVKDILRNIEMADTVMEQAYDYFETERDEYRRKHGHLAEHQRSKEQQQTVEELLNNELFVITAKIKTLGA